MLYSYKFKVTRVIDGDTVDGNIDLGFGIYIEHRIRLMGIDTPETRTLNKNEKKVGNVAKEFVKAAIYDSSVVVIHTHKDSAGKFGRILGEIFLDGDPVSLNDKLIEEKLAVPYTGAAKVSFEENVSAGLIIDPATLP